MSSIVRNSDDDPLAIAIQHITAAGHDVAGDIQIMPVQRQFR